MADRVAGALNDAQLTTDRHRKVELLSRVTELVLQTAPASLPSELRGAALFVAQDISGAGFGAQFSERAPGLRFSELRSQTSRKTVLPAILHFCASG